LLAGQMGARLDLVVDPAHRDVVRDVVGRIKPEVNVRYPELEAWSLLLPYLDEQLRENDLLVLLGAREGTFSWRPAINRLPRVLSKRFPSVNFITVYPSEAALGLPEERPRRGSAPAPLKLVPSAILVGLPEGTLDESLRRLLEKAFPDDRPAQAAVVAKLRTTLETYAVEILPGLALLQATVEEVSEPTFLVATSEPGLRGDSLGSQVHVLLVLLSPSGDEDSRHLRMLSRLARTVRSAHAVDMLRGAAKEEEVREVFARAFTPAPGEPSLPPHQARATTAAKQASVHEEETNSSTQVPSPDAGRVLGPGR
jgi:mannitol/fructose-specific phosphotransferase system IIA component (Ntr-type)